MPVGREEEQDLNTQDPELEQEEVDSNQDGGDSDSSSSEDDQPRVRKPFLEVDERTKYNTREEAVRGYAEAGKRIAALSAWEKELKDYDVTPTDVRSYLDELIETRQTAAQLQAELKHFKEERERERQESRDKGGNSNSATRVDPAAKLTKEEKEAVEWMKEQLPGLGLISKEEAMAQIKALTEAKDQSTGRLDKLEAFQAQQQEQYRQSLLSDSRSKLKNWMGEDGYTDNEEGSLQLVIESYIKSWIESDQTGRRLQKYFSGGDLKDAVVKEGYEKVKGALGMVKSTSSTTYAKSKAAALKRNGKVLPNPDITKGKPSSGKSKPKLNSAGKRDYIGEKHNEAWEVASRIFSNNEEGQN